MNELLLAITFMCIATLLLVGILVGAINRDIRNIAGCEYKSYLSKYNPPFRLGCELVKDRTK